jgi:hypothetical protein
MKYGGQIDGQMSQSSMVWWYCNDPCRVELIFLSSAQKDITPCRVGTSLTRVSCMQSAVHQPAIEQR